MKRKITTALTIFATMTGLAKAPQVNVTKIEPQDWFAGMKNEQLQLMVSGQGISQAQVSRIEKGALDRIKKNIF